MAGKKKTMDFKKSLSGSGRMLLIIGGLFLVGAVVAMFAIRSLTADTAGQAQASVKAAPQGRGAPTGENADQQYQNMVREQNERLVEQALATGESAVPTLIGGESFEACDFDCQAERERLANELSEAAMREAQLKEQLERARNALEASQTPPEVNRHYYVHDGREFMTHEYREADVQRMRAELQQVAAQYRPTGSLYESSGYDPKKNEQGNAAAGGADQVNPGRGDAQPVYLIDAGEIVYATLDLEANSDVPGPLRATVQGGKYNGAKMLGAFQVSNEYLVIRFNKMVTQAGKHFDVNVIAIDPGRRLAGMADHVDHHYLQRFGALLGAAFLQGYGEAVIAANEVTRTSEFSEEVVSTLDTTKDQALAAMAKVGDELANIVRPYASRPPTVIKYADTGMGLLFLEPVEL